MRSIVAAIALLIPSAANTEPGADYGNGFLSLCGDSPNMYCIGFIRGLRTAPAIFSPTKPTDSLQKRLNSAAYCFPERSTDGQVLDTLIAFLKNNPAVRHYPIYPLYAKAMNDVWPCQGGPTVLLGGEGIMQLIPQNSD